MLTACPKCQRLFPEDAGKFCPSDATHLLPADQVAIPEDSQDPLLGKTIASRYEIRRTIADGGMGRVYEARDTQQQQRVAVKILHQEIAQDAVNIERFKREATTSKELPHDFIVDVLDFAEEKPAPGRPDGAWYLVMEYLDGEELRTLLNNSKKLPLHRTVRILSQTSIALDSAHAKGFVHRDLKPDNIFLVHGPQGDTVKVLDFGSVKLTKGADRSQKLTVMGTTIGSPFYMSPEQAKGAADLDHRADIWALGAMLYEIIVGKVPFNAPNGPQILFKIIGEEPMPPSLASDDAPTELDEVVLKALSKKKENRFETCGQFADALGHALGLQGTHQEWAKLSESDIQNRLSAKTPAQPAPITTTQTNNTTNNTNNQPNPYPNNVPPDNYSPIKPTSPVIYLVVGAAVLLLVVIAVFALR